jgi:hypothetical protein
MKPNNLFGHLWTMEYKYRNPFEKAYLNQWIKRVTCCGVKITKWWTDMMKSRQLNSLLLWSHDTTLLSTTQKMNQCECLYKHILESLLETYYNNLLTGNLTITMDIQSNIKVTAQWYNLTTSTASNTSSEQKTPEKETNILIGGRIEVTLRNKYFSYQDTWKWLKLSF